MGDNTVGRITFITAFFDIGRKQWSEGNFSRSNDKYLQYFEEWASVCGNDLIIYTDVEEFVDKIKEIRKNISARTEVIYIKDRHVLAPEVFSAISSVNISRMQAYRLLPNNPEVVNYEYNYVMMLKHVLVLKAVDDFKLVGDIGWIDFGVSHVTGTDIELYESALENERNKVTLFTGNNLKEMNECVVFDAICKMESLIYGSLFFGPYEKMCEFARNCLEAQRMINIIGLMDDDQMMMFMAWRKRPFDYHLVQCYWGDMLRLCRGFSPSGYLDNKKSLKQYLRKIKRLFIKEKNVIRFRHNLFKFDWPQ